VVRWSIESLGSWRRAEAIDLLDLQIESTRRALTALSLDDIAAEYVAQFQRIPYSFDKQSLIESIIAKRLRRAMDFIDSDNRKS
jgi:hypothetical protein